MRLVDANALKSYVKNFNIGCGCSEDYQKGFLDAIDDQPTIEERKTGKWIYAPDEPLGYVCSECKKGCCRFDYCPHCGAEMEVNHT